MTPKPRITDPKGRRPNECNDSKTEDQRPKRAVFAFPAVKTSFSSREERRGEEKKGNERKEWQPHTGAKRERKSKRN